MNTISKELKVLAGFLEDNEHIDLHPGWVDDLNEYAELVERLVKAAEAVMEERAGAIAECRKSFVKLHAELAAIEESENEDAKRNG